MKKGLLVSILSGVILVGCQSGKAEERVDELQEKINEQNKTIEQLEAEKQDMTKQNEELHTKVDKKEGELTASESQLRSTQSYQKHLDRKVQTAHEQMETLLSESDMARKTAEGIIGVFDKSTVEIEDRVGALTASDIEKVDKGNGFYRYDISFTGEYEVRGMVYENIGHGGYFIYPDPDQMAKVPHHVNELSMIHFKNEDEFVKAMGGSIEGVNFEDGVEHGVRVTLKLRDYQYNFIPESHSKDYAAFVELVKVDP